MNCSKHVIGIIDDDLSFYESTAYFLKRNGYEVEFFNSGDDFLTKYKNSLELQSRLDLIILDILMPGIDGYSLLQEIRNDPKYKGLKIVIMSSENTIENRAKFIDDGADDFVAKSDSITELLARVKARLKESNAGSHNDHIIKTMLVDTGSEIRINNAPIGFTISEYLIISTLLMDVDNFVSKGELEDIVFGVRSKAKARALDYHINRIRTKFQQQKLEMTPMLITRRGYGVKLSWKSSRNSEQSYA